MSNGIFERYREINNKYWARALSVVEVHTALDTFYEIPENAPIAIFDAIHVIAKRSQGAGEAELQKLTADLRARANKAQESSQ